LVVSAALHFSCTQQLYAVAGARALVTVSATTAAVTPVCTLATQPTAALRVIAFVDDGRLAHFVGSSTPTMELLSLSNTGTVTCVTATVAAYRTAAAVFNGAPVVAAHRDVNSNTPRVLVVAGSPSELYAVTDAGVITLIAAIRRATDALPVSPYTLFFTGAKATVCRGERARRFCCYCLRHCIR
jgi:hypothetical protein